MFSGTGEFLRTIGRRGSGPAEFRDLVHVSVGEGDTLYLSDRSLGRVAVTSKLGEAIRHTQGVKPSISMLRLPSGEFVVNTDYLDRDRIGYPLHLHSPDGKYLRSFGSLRPEYGPRVQTDRKLAASSAGTVWSAHPWRYELEEWSTDGERKSYWRRNANWFPPLRGQVASASPTQAPRPYVMAIHIDREQRLWVVVTVSDPDWSSAFGPPRRVGNSRRPQYPIDDYDKLYDSIIEVIDLRSGALLASRRFRRYIMHFLNDSTVAGPRLGEYGDRRVEVWGVRLIQR